MNVLQPATDCATKHGSVPRNEFNRPMLCETIAPLLGPATKPLWHEGKQTKQGSNTDCSK